MEELNQIAKTIIGAAIEVHRELGPGLLESTYEMCLCHELSLRGLLFERQKPLHARYKAVNLDCGYRLDLLVCDSVVVEIKSVAEVTPIHEAQLLSYLELGGRRVGLIINFNVEFLRKGIRRPVLNKKNPPLRLCGDKSLPIDRG